MRFGSLFSGIGGLDLGLQRAGHECRWQVELDPYCVAVLRKHWPDVPKYGDIRELSGDDLEPVDLIAGGFPCQPVSLAGRRRGAADERWLWPEFARLIRVLRPRYALLENVPGLLAGGGMAEVLGDLAASGYDAEWDCIPAAAVGAPHLRYRVFIVAYARRISDERREVAGDLAGEAGAGAGEAPQRQRVRDAAIDRGPAVPDADQRGRQSVGIGGLLDGERSPLRDDADRRGGEDVPYADRAERRPQTKGRDESNWSDSRRQEETGGPRLGSPAATLADADSAARSAARSSGQEIFRPGAVERLGRRRGSLGHQWLSEPDVGRVAHGIPSRVDRLRALGNAVVPQVAEVIGRALMEADS